MKNRLLLLILAVCMAISLTACIGGKKEVPTDGSGQAAASMESGETSVEPENVGTESTEVSSAPQPDASADKDENVGANPLPVEDSLEIELGEDEAYEIR